MEATYYQIGEKLDYLPAVDVGAGEVLHLPDGRAGVPANAITASRLGAVQVTGVFDVTKTASIVMLDGDEVWWDASAGAAILKPAGGGSDEDFCIGVVYGDAASAATTVRVKLNERPRYIIDVHRDPFAHVPVLTAGTPVLSKIAGTIRAAFSATAEAQKLDLLSRRSFPIDSKWILDAIVNIQTNGDADVVDLVVGVANDTHASDPDSIAEFCGIHLDPGADLDIMAESDDGTTEVAATDTTLNWAVGTPLRITIDGRDETDIQIFINGVLVLSGTTFTLAAATGPLKALFLVEKSANDSPCVAELDELCVRIMD